MSWDPFFSRPTTPESSTSAAQWRTPPPPPSRQHAHLTQPIYVRQRPAAYSPPATHPYAPSNAMQPSLWTPHQPQQQQPLSLSLQPQPGSAPDVPAFFPVHVPHHVPQYQPPLPPGIAQCARCGRHVPEVDLPRHNAQQCQFREPAEFMVSADGRGPAYIPGDPTLIPRASGAVRRARRELPAHPPGSQFDYPSRQSSDSSSASSGGRPAHGYAARAQDDIPLGGTWRTYMEAQRAPAAPARRREHGRR